MSNHTNNQADLPDEVWAEVDFSEIAQRPEGSWLALLDQDDAPMHRIVCHSFPQQVGLTSDVVNHKVSHISCDTNPLINLIVAKWRVQGWFVNHIDGDRGNNAVTNMRVIGLKQALELGGSSDWDLFLSEDECDTVRAMMHQIVTGLM